MDHNYINNKCKNCGLCRKTTGDFAKEYNYYIADNTIVSGTKAVGSLTINWMFYLSEPSCGKMIMESVMK